MLTADLVKPSQRGGVLRVKKLTGKTRERALQIAADLVEQARAHKGATRAEVDEATKLAVGARQRVLMLGLRKLLLDRCEFEESAVHEPAELRRLVWETATAARRREGAPTTFDRDAVLDDVARVLDSSSGDVDSSLFADLKAAHRLTTPAITTPEALLERYDLAQAQAILLRATRVVAHVGGAEPAAFRALFRKLKFLRLLFRAEPDGDDGFRLEIDGPMSLFSQSSKYGLELALALPSLAALPRCRVEAEVKWGKRRSKRSFEWEPKDAGLYEPPSGNEALRDDVARLLQDVNERDAGWRAEPADVVLPLPGVGVCVPDLAFINDASGVVVYLEALGFWSRDAVWKRVKLVEAGLDERIVFAASSRLRVSERALKDDASGALYVYKGVMSARRVLDLITDVAAR